MLKYRIMTAIIALPMIIWGILALPSLWVAILFGVLLALGAWEWTSLIKLISLPTRFAYVVIVCLGMYLATWIPVYYFLVVALFIWLWSFLVTASYNRERGALGFGVPPIRAVLGFWVLISTWLAIILLHSVPVIGPRLLLFCFVVVWVADTGAYFVGRLWGKHSLAKRVSPNKTWEGLWGGVVTGLITAVICSYFLHFTIKQQIYFWCISIVAVVFSIVGDLTISVFKRQNNVKDTGAIFPGHGGVLDRVDSIASSSVIYALGIIWFLT